MNPTAKTTLVCAFGVTAFLAFLFGDGSPSWAVVSTAMADDAGTYGVRWMWLPGLLVAVPVFALVWAMIRGA